MKKMLKFKTEKSCMITKKTFTGIAIILFLFIIGWVVWGIVCCVGNYNDNVYTLSRADSQFNRALGTNNLDIFADYTEAGLLIIDGYSGNEAWFYPTISTDMDSIKLDISLIIDNARIASNSTPYGSDAYQEALDNAKESLRLQMGRLNDVEGLYMGFGKSYIGLIWGYIAVLIVAIILLIWTGYLADDIEWYYRRQKGRD